MALSRKKIAIAVAIVVAVGAGVRIVGPRLLARLRARSHGHEKPVAGESRLRLATIAPTSSRLLAGDARLGAALYAAHCVSCHGFSGRGDGPATSWLHPAGRDHTSAYMAARTDEDLTKTIDEGGRSSDRSSLMPSFSDRFDDMETWALVAYLRTLHPNVASLFPAGARLEPEPIVVKPARLPALAAEDRRVDLLRAYAGAPASERTVGFALVERVAGAPDSLWVAAVKDEAGAFTRRVLPEVEVVSARGVALRGVLEDAVATGRVARPLPADVAALVSNVQLTATKTEARLRAALAQREDEIARSETIIEKFRKEPSSFPPVEATFLRSCASCHGATGQAVGANTTLHPTARPQNLADGVYLDPLPDEHLAFVIRHGGGPARHSGAMPGFGAAVLDEQQIQELVRYVRTLAIPPHAAKGAVAHGH